MPYHLEKQARLQPLYPITRHLQKRKNYPPALTIQELLETEVQSLAEKRLLCALSEARYLTISQIAELFYAVKADGQPANEQTVRPRPNEEYTTTAGYGSARKLIKGCEARGTLVLHEYKHKQYNKERRDRTVPKLVMLPTQKPPAPSNWWHEVERGQLYVDFHKTGKIIGWYSKWPRPEYMEFGKRHGVQPDSMFELDGVDCRFCIELDRGTEDWTDLEEKIQKYAGLMQSAGSNICPIFFLQPGYRLDLRAKGLKLVQTIQSLGRRQPFLVTSYELALSDPLAAVYDDCYTSTPRSPLDFGSY